jgi:hypothetical protein
MRLPGTTRERAVCAGLVLAIVMVVVFIAVIFRSDSAKEQAQTGELKAQGAQRQANAVLDCLTGPRPELCLSDLVKVSPASRGAAGRRGARGGTGPQGPLGPPGPRGRRGPRGIPGASPKPPAPLPGPAGADGAPGEPGRAPTMDEIRQAVDAFCDVDDRCRGARGQDGQDGRGPTDAEIAAAVEAYCAARNQCQGPQGQTGSPGADSTVPGPQGPPVGSFTFTDAVGVQQTCTDPEGDGSYACAPG